MNTERESKLQNTYHVFYEAKINIVLCLTFSYILFDTRSRILISQRCITFITSALIATWLHSQLPSKRKNLWWKFDSEINLMVGGYIVSHLNVGRVVGRDAEWGSPWVKKLCSWKHVRFQADDDDDIFPIPVIRLSLIGAENQCSTRGPRPFSCHTLETNNLETSEHIDTANNNYIPMFLWYIHSAKSLYVCTYVCKSQTWLISCK